MSERKLVCVICGSPWNPPAKNRCECGGFCTWGPAKGAEPSSMRTTPGALRALMFIGAGDEGKNLYDKIMRGDLDNNVNDAVAFDRILNRDGKVIDDGSSD